MATIINNPPANQSPAPADEGGNAMMLIVGVLIIAVVIFLFVVYGLPMMRGANNVNNDSTQPTTNINVPDKINVTLPDKVDVNVNK